MCGWSRRSECIFLPGFPRHARASVVASTHGRLAATVLGLGLSVVLVAGTGLIAPRFRFGHDQLWMRTRLALWGATLGFGLSTHWVARMTAPLTERRLRGEVRVVESRERGAIFRDGR